MVQSLLYWALPFSVVTSTSTVGLPRLSKICLALTAFIVIVSVMSSKAIKHWTQYTGTGH